MKSMLLASAATVAMMFGMSGTSEVQAGDRHETQVQQVRWGRGDFDRDRYRNSHRRHDYRYGRSYGSPYYLQHRRPYRQSYYPRYGYYGNRNWDRGYQRGGFTIQTPGFGFYVR